MEKQECSTMVRYIETCELTEPTPEMIAAASDRVDTITPAGAVEVYKAMIAKLLEKYSPSDE
jgi:hypothetical protein